MKLIHEEDDAPNLLKFCLPHHCVFKVSSSTTKLRVVFDGSSKSSSGISLNDALIVGLVIQLDLISIILRFRTLPYVFTADIKKMYRQVLVHPSQTSLQRKAWRDDDKQNINTYELVTITYGTAAASYLATRCLKYLAEKHALPFPTGSQHVLRDFYVDDLLTGADYIAKARTIRKAVTEILKQGSFVLDNWSSNSELLSVPVSKRLILSEIAKLFDPLGLLGPIVIVAKLLIQELWQLNVH
ncbi:hypothetical protein KM043_013073 [Ampulex compressa]|nr:hypothetical protein KM043_013073 [Ampulex compressa]